MQKHIDEQETEQGSLIDSLRSVHWAEALPSFVLSLGYPFLFWILHAARVHKQRKTRLLLNVLGFVLTILFGLYGIEPLLNWIGVVTPNEWYKKLAVLFSLTATCNVLLYIVVLTFDLHNLFRVSFRRAGKESVSEWLSHILGHKLWAGENTYQLLEHIQEESRALGRAKWLLVGFLSTDIDRKIQRDPDKKGDTTGKIDDTLKSVHPIYKITVHDWSVRTYSNFLADNMTHAMRSINWVVDPVDLIAEIIPAHMIEVVVSVGSIADADIAREIEKAKNALADDALSIKWGTLLGRYAQWCPRPLVRSVDCDRKCKRGLDKCPDSFPFEAESPHRQFDYLWYALFAGTLAALKSATVDGNSVKLKNGMRISWTDVLSSYSQREDIVGSLVLPHIDEFRKAACAKRRHIYLGIMPGNPSAVDERIKQGIANLKEYINHKNEYIKCIVPCPEKPSSDNGLYSSLLAYSMTSQGFITCERPRGTDDLWASVTDDEVCRMLLVWAIKLLEHTSGGKGFVKGVFVPDHVTDLDYKDCHDIGFYDGLLVLSSGRGKNRDVTWRVYQGPPRLERFYFPEENDERVVAFDELTRIIMGALQ